MLFDLLIDHLRAKARELGYAIGVHGTIAFDIDLIAVPWIDDAVDARTLAEALADTARGLNGGIAHLSGIEADDEWFQAGCQPYGKPHGRYCWCFHLGGPYIDLSVMPRSADMIGRKDLP